MPDRRLRPVSAVLPPAPPMTATLRRFIDWVAASALQPARRRAAHGDERARGAGGTGAAGRLDPRPARQQPATHHPGAAAGAGCRPPRGGLCRWPCWAQAAGVSLPCCAAWRRTGCSRPALLPHRSRFARPDPEHPGPALGPAQAEAAATLRCRGPRRRPLHGHAPQGRHGLRQDRGLFRSRRRGAGPRTPGAGAATRDRARCPVPRRRSRRARGRAAAVACGAGARAAGDVWRHRRRGPGARRRRRPLARCSCIPRARPHRRRRGARRAPTSRRTARLSRARHGGRPRLDRGCRRRLARRPRRLKTVANVERREIARAGSARPASAAPAPRGSRGRSPRATPPERQRLLAPPLCRSDTDPLAAGEQSMLFLNRRGYAPLTLCRALRAPPRNARPAPPASSSIASARLVQCHQCGHAKRSRREFCADCGATRTAYAACGPGVERVAEEVGAALHKARAADHGERHAAGAAYPRGDDPRRAKKARSRFSRETPVMAKGHHFPNLHSGRRRQRRSRPRRRRPSRGGAHLPVPPPGRGTRRTRGGDPGRVLLQSWIPENPVVAGARRRRPAIGFLARGSGRAPPPRHRPPFGRLAALIVSRRGRARSGGSHRRATSGVAAPRAGGGAGAGPGPGAAVALLRGRHRRRLLLKTRRDVAVQPILREWLARVPVPSHVRVQVDVDPVGFLLSQG